MHRPAQLVVSAAAVLCAWAAPARALDLVVDPGGGGDHTTIAAAVAAAAPDDLILVRAGTYTGDVTLDGKPLWIVADAAPGIVIVNGTLTIRNLASEEIAVVVDLDVRGPIALPASAPGLRLLDNVGEVRLQGCVFRGGNGFVDSGHRSGGPPGPGATVQSCARVTLSDSVFRGGTGMVLGGHPGADGLVETTSSVAAWGCEFRGGQGGTNGGEDPFGSPTDGGAGFRATSFGVFAAGSLFQGGRGGTDNDVLCIEVGGDGGPGLFLPGVSTQARLMSSTLVGGLGGNSCPMNPPGNPGPTFTGGGTPITVSGAARWLEGQAVVSAGVAAPLTIRGAPGDTVYLRQDDEARYQFKVARKGFDLVDARWMAIEPFAVPGSGTLVTTRADHAWNGGDRTRLFGQAYVVTASGAIVLGGPLALVVGP
jgi:hypothetical protein